MQPLGIVVLTTETTRQGWLALKRPCVAGFEVPNDTIRLLAPAVALAAASFLRGTSRKRKREEELYMFAPEDYRCQHLFLRNENGLLQPTREHSHVQRPTIMLCLGARSGCYERIGCGSWGF